MAATTWRSGLLPDALEQELDAHQESFCPPSIVVVDDEADFCELVATHLDDGHSQIVQCSDARTALATIEEMRPNLAIVDIRLPEMDGFTLVSRARKASPSTVFLMMSAHTSVDLVLEAMRKDVHDYLPKPLPSADDLRRTVGHALEKQRLQTVYALQTLVGTLTLSLDGISSVGETRPLFFRTLVRGVGQLCPGVCVGIAFMEGDSPKVILDAPTSWHKEMKQVLDAHLAAMLQKGRQMGGSAPVLPNRNASLELRSTRYPSMLLIHVRTRRGVEALVCLASTKPRALPRESVDLCVWFSRNAGIVMERHQANLDLEHHMLGNQLDHLSDAVAVFDKTLTKVHYLNLEAKTLLAKVGNEAGVAAVRNLPQMFAAAQTPGKPLARGPARTELTLQVEGEDRIFEVSMHPFDSPVRVSYNMFVFHEITHLRREATKIQELNEELRIQNLHLEAMNKELDNFVYIASHDLQEPFRHIDIFARYLQRDLQDNPAMTPETAFHLDQIMRNSDVACRILADLRTLSRMTRIQGVRRRLSLGQIVREVVERFTSELASGTVRIRLRSLPMLKCDAIKMKELFQNLIANAIKYNQSQMKEIEIGCLSRGQEQLVYVKDNGVGIDPEDQEYIFEPFKILAVKGIARGSGLGLYIARKVVEEHEGKIWVESKSGEGSTFFMSFPASAHAKSHR